MPKNVVRCSVVGGTREELRMAEGRAVAIRKLLRQLKGRLRRGVMSDAERLARTIESLARYGQHCSAEDAVDIAFRIGALASLLEIEVDHLCTL